MSFFGLTAFGPENFIQSSLVNSSGFTLFSIDDFQKGFQKVCKINNLKGVISLSNVKEFLHHTFGFTPLDDEVKGKTEQDEILTWEEVVDILNRLKENQNSTSIKSKKYVSNKSYYDDIYKHKRKEVSPNETFKVPVTYSQSYGFYKFNERNLNEIKYPKKKCEETKYAESMILTGNSLLK